MNHSFTTFFTIIFIILVGLFGIGLILNILKHLLRKKLIEYILRSPEEKQQIYIRTDSRLISIYKILFWMAPVYLLLIPIVFYLFLPDQFLYAAIVITLMYVLIFEDFLYRRSILKAIK